MGLRGGVDGVCEGGGGEWDVGEGGGGALVGCGVGGGEGGQGVGVSDWVRVGMVGGWFE